MPLYEHVVISRQDLSNAQAEGLVEHFGKVLSENGGKVVDSEYWGLKTMAYKINKNRKGHYSFLKTDSPSDAVQEILIERHVTMICFLQKRCTIMTFALQKVSHAYHRAVPSQR